MKVLMIHNRYKIMGGEDVSTNAEAALLKDSGLDLETLIITNDSIENENMIGLAINTVWSKKYHQLLLKKIKENKYDIIHVQNFFPLFSPSIFYAAQKAGTKIIMTVRNYRLICPNGLMYVHGAVCEQCVGKTIPYPALMKKCYRESLGATSVTVGMLAVHNILNTWDAKVDGYICISEFVKDQLKKGGFKADKLHVKYNFVVTDLPPVYEPEDYYVYLGRISTEKGIDILLDAFQKNKKRLLIIGDGPLKDEVIQASKMHSNIEYLGKLPLNDSYKIVSRAKALIFPSKWHEPFGRTIVEAFAHATPVIGAKMGGVTELIKDGYNGFLFDPSNAAGLNQAIDALDSVADKVKLRQNAFESYKNSFTPEKNLKSILEIYDKFLQKSQKGTVTT
ncbi:glycosyltransferase family 4 protein [Flavobacterium sp.]|uniref:glycosyltransferase family 4 protein n=1 Tax=Flavobacterium sp. TaxID=239 RepID=UPI0025BC097B|nr:glycosyltransferase family 4 protein [Flavobacterium sp.]